MRGYLGKRDIAQAPFESDDPESEPDQVSAPAPPPYDLVYILDAIYHFPPSVPYFLASVLPALRPGSGVIAYTDILPPPHVNAALGHLVLPTVLGVPARNLMQRPKTLEAYEALLGRIGFEDVVVEDWSQGVWPGFAKNLRDRGGVWATVGRGISAAESTGWRFIAARARRPHLDATNNAY